MLMGPHNCAVQIELLEIGVVGQFSKHAMPDLLVRPPRESPVDAVPYAKPRREVSPEALPFSKSTELLRKTTGCPCTRYPRYFQEVTKRPEPTDRHA